VGDHRSDSDGFSDYLRGFYPERRPVRRPRQPRQRPTSAAPSCAKHRARQLKRHIIHNFQLSLAVSYSDAGASSPRFTETGSILLGGKVCIWKQARELVIMSKSKSTGAFHLLADEIT
jgi:hypothetical protein